MKLLLNLLIALTSISYPLLWLWNRDISIIIYLPAIMAILWLLKAMLQQGIYRYFSFIFAGLLGLAFISRLWQLMYWYPVIINIFMLLLFATSLWQKQSLVERLARLTTPNLSLQGIKYTRIVTQIWCIVFTINLIITLYFIVQQHYDYWALYTGIISYIIIGLVMGIEWLIRQKVKKQHAV